MQKVIAFHHDKAIDMLKLCYTLPNLANICLHKHTDTKFYQFIEGDKDFLEQNWEDVFGFLSIVFIQKAGVDETFIRKSANLCKPIVGIDASQLYFYSMCHPKSTGLYTRRDLKSETDTFTPRWIKTRSFENFVKSYSQRTRREFKIENFSATGRQN